MTDQFLPTDDDIPPEVGPASARFDIPEPPHPINWNLLTANDLEAELLELNRWVDWLRHTYGLPASVIPPCWHRHPELLWELSALHLHWLRLRPRPERLGTAGLASRLRRRPSPPPGLGGDIRNPSGPGPTHTPDELAG